MRVLVTGAAGFIGRHCLPLLRARGYDVHGVSAAARQHDGATWHRCDLLDHDAAQALVRKVRPERLLHLAWIAQPGVFWTSPENIAWLYSSQRLLAAFYAAGGEHAVVAGSCAEYAGSAAPLREDAPIAPATPYGRAKAALLTALPELGAGAWAWARIFLPYGPGEPAGRFIPSLIDALLRGKTLECTEGRQVRDFVYVDDVAEACVRLLECRAYGVFNVGTGEGRTLREVAGRIVARLGHPELVLFGARQAPAHELPAIVADNARIRAETGWSPRTSLEEGLARAIASRAAALKEAP